MLRIAIDGACRRNGKPDCVSAGGVFVQHHDKYHVFSVSEKQSTNQRGEMLALIKALGYVSWVLEDAQIITDSEYLFNAAQNEWAKRWANNDWRTASGEVAKNKDLWQQIFNLTRFLEDRNVEVTYYHIKGHCITFGKVKAINALNWCNDGSFLYAAVSDKYTTDKELRAEQLEAAQVLSQKNNGFRLPNDLLKEFVVCNTVADAIATREVENADR